MTLFAPQGRWRVYTDAVAGPLLTEWVSSSVSVPRTGVGACELVVPRGGDNVDLVLGDFDAVLGYETMSPLGAWTEPANCRFLPAQRSYDDATDTLKLSGVSMGWLTGKAVRWRQVAGENTDGKVVIENWTAGQILQWFYYWAALTSGLSNITIDWDGTDDSDGNPWVRRYSVTYDRGVTWRQVLDGLASDGLVWRFAGFTMQAAQDGFADEIATQPILYNGVDVQVDAIGVSSADVAGAIMVTGDGTASGVASVQTVPTWGRWQMSQSQSGMSNAAELGRIAAAELTRRGLVRESATVTLLPSSDYRPFDTVGPGQTLTVILDADSSGARWDVSRWDLSTWGEGSSWWREMSGRVEEIVISDDGKEAKVSLRIGEQTATATDLLTRTVTAITGGRVPRGVISGRA